jgi:ParB family chromosome partitioning protein
MPDKIRKLLGQKQSKLTMPPEKREKIYSPSSSSDAKFPDGSFKLIPLEDILPDLQQPRKYFDPKTLEELAQSIKQKGVLQPVIVRVDEKEKFHLVAGERRYRAAKIAELVEMPAMITKGNPMEIALIENLQRDDLKPLEEAEALGRMIEEYHYKQEDLALVIGKAKSTISEILSLNRLSETIKGEIRASNLYSKKLLVEIAKQKTPEKMEALFNQVKTENIKSHQVRNLSRKPSKKTQRSQAILTLNKIKSLSKHIDKLDLDVIEKDIKEQIYNELKNLRSSIEDILA